MSVLFIAIFAGLALLGVSALLIFAVAGDQSPTEARLAELGSLPAANSSYRVGDLFSLLTQPLAPFRDWLRSRDEELTYRLSVAGYRKPEDVDTFLSAKLLAPVVGILLATFTGRDNMLLWSLLLGAAGFFAPDVFLISAMNRRKSKLALALPDVMDLIVICMEAGLGLDHAVIKIAAEMEVVYPEMSEELSIIGREQRAGKPRVDAWRSMADRVDLEMVRQFAAMLIQTDRLGTPIAHALGQFADALRTQRMMEAEERAAKTTIKLIFPLVSFIFPTIFVVLLGSAAIALIQGLG